MRDELGYRFHSRLNIFCYCTQIALEKLGSAETHLESLIDDSNPNKDALVALRNVQDLIVQSRVILQEANK